MKDFDVERAQRSIVPAKDRTFKLGGELFVRRPAVPAWVMTRLDEIVTASPGQTLVIIDDLIDEMCEEPAATRWALLRARGRNEDPITLMDVLQVVQWLIGEETSFPTTPPSSSGGSSESPPSGDPSTDASPSPVSIQPIFPSDDSSAPPTPS